MSACPEMRVLFAAPAGAKRGFGHLVRCRSLARALGVRPLVAVRGPQGTVDVALRLGCDVVIGTPARLIRSLRPDVVIVDDPIEMPASRWISTARAAGAVVVSIHDLGLGCLDADLLIDGSVVRSRALQNRKRSTPKHEGAKSTKVYTKTNVDLIGPAFAILDPDTLGGQNARRSVPAALRRRKSRSAASSGERSRREASGLPSVPAVVISLGGGPRAKLACAIAVEIARRAPDVDVRIVGGFVSARPPRGLARTLPRNVTWLAGATNLSRELTRADVAIVGGGVSLYEACALGTPAVAVPVVAAQRPTVAGFVAEGAALGSAHGTVAPRHVAANALAALRQPRLRRRLTRAARRLVDGRGAVRAARVIARLLEGR
jgi:spore coat polysaccharide biosynthesis predicted glycosyltransferase SpsG